MRARTVVALALVVVALGVLAIGSFLVDTDSGRKITVLWVSETGREVNGNHHAPAVAQVGDGQFVYAPISGRADTDRCALYGLAASSGERQWSSGIAVPECTIHSIADPTVVDYDGDVETLVMYGDGRVVALDFGRA